MFHPKPWIPLWKISIFFYFFKNFLENIFFYPEYKERSFSVLFWRRKLHKIIIFIFWQKLWTNSFGKVWFFCLFQKIYFSTPENNFLYPKYQQRWRKPWTNWINLEMGRIPTKTFTWRKVCISWPVQTRIPYM